LKSACNHQRTALAFHGGKSYILVCQKCFINVDGVSYLIGIPMKKISISSLGQLAKADIEFGDMTILVGPQASGKSILLQLFKLALDYGHITKTLKRYYDWKGSNDFLSLYFGEGMRGIWHDSTQVLDDGNKFDLSILSRKGPKRDEAVLLIPAQRVITLKDGWPRTFLDYTAGDPYVVRQFSEHLRQLMESGLGAGRGAIFPQIGRMNEVIRKAIDESIFNGAEVRLDKTTMRKRIVLKVGNYRLPFMVWSAGQREFIPLLMGLYWLMPSKRIRKKKNIQWVIIEEPEMGLHPQAISALLIVFLELMHRGYKVIISTHSPQILELVWAIQNLSKLPTVDAFLKMFDLKKTGFLSKLSEDILTGKSFKTYYFAKHYKKFKAIDISTLDPGSMNEAVSEWGGLTSFSTRVSEVVSEAAQGEL
jgi:energy-coupling factor transporter ATP-binding protein EcfA2